MSTLSPEQIAHAAHEAGFRGHDLTTAVAIALAESGGDPHAHNPVPPDNSYGLWQINMIGALGPDRRDQFHLDANKELFDPETNAQAAFAISGNGDSFQPWTTFTNGDYRDHLDAARKGVHAFRHNGKNHHDDKHGGKHDGKHGGNGDGDRLRVDPHALHEYARGTRTIADELSALRKEELRNVRSIAEDSFGRIGKETGFADALDGFGRSLGHQVDGVGRNLSTLAGSVAKTARHYQNQEADIAEDLLRLMPEA